MSRYKPLHLIARLLCTTSNAYKGHHHRYFYYDIDSDNHRNITFIIQSPYVRNTFVRTKRITDDSGSILTTLPGVD
ncbi:hypothetical protein CANCADRAFT_30800 [Tortispora caseinolytica NRRL Y-17796]|uniref:Uncharacterized protein n=1 Tax=Tortispora caseinolytica NRRL Y-17796 TaxID=767744 RepID=A0A1E4TLV5_9ASCO|nr:hypothetical protein CANCADRAFT_30800 [Tortispora caseinolytica NRRL Y-17796]